jgi:hypothetical protein
MRLEYLLGEWRIFASGFERSGEWLFKRGFRDSKRSLWHFRSCLVLNWAGRLCHLPTCRYAGKRMALRLDRPEMNHFANIRT